MTQVSTPLDQTHAAMAEGDAARLAYYGRLVDSEMHLLLEAEAEGDSITPRVFELEDGPVVLAFDLAERLAAFTESAAASAVMPGRQLIAMLAGQGIGLGINLGVAPSSMLLGADAVDWLAAQLADDPASLQARPEEIFAPAGIPEALLLSLDASLAQAEGLAASAYLVSVRYEGGVRGTLLGIIDPVPGAEDTLARAVARALKFSGVEAGQLDTAFFRATDPVAARLARVGLRFDLPVPTTEATPRPAPGSDPDKPPILR